MKAARIWTFIVGDSRFAPVGVVVAVCAALFFTRVVPASGPLVGVVYVAIIAATLVAAVFERSR